MRPPGACVTLALAAALVLASCSRAGLPAGEAARFNGTWTSGSGEFKVWALDELRLQVEFRGAYAYDSPAGPMVNVGAAEGIAAIDGDAARLQPQGSDDDCVITLRASGERLEVAEAGSCGFGLNVTAAGTYERVSRDRPRFEPL